jgi:hypothetical protein
MCGGRGGLGQTAAAAAALQCLPFHVLEQAKQARGFSDPTKLDAKRLHLDKQILRRGHGPSGHAE